MNHRIEQSLTRNGSGIVDPTNLGVDPIENIRAHAQHIIDHSTESFPDDPHDISELLQSYLE